MKNIDLKISTEESIFIATEIAQNSNNKSVIIFSSDCSSSKTKKVLKKRSSITYSQVNNAYFNNPALKKMFVEALKGSLNQFKEDNSKKIYIFQTEDLHLQKRTLMTLSNITL